MQKNRQRITRFIEEFMNKGNDDVAREVVAPGVVSHSAMPGQAPGVEGVIQTFGMFRKAFSDFTVELKDIVADGDTVMTYAVVTGTHTGDFMGMPPTNKPIRYEEMTVFHFKDGQVVEHWAVADAYALMQQVGAIPT